VTLKKKILIITSTYLISVATLLVSVSTAEHIGDVVSEMDKRIG